jgi:hypothetical protein
MKATEFAFWLQGLFELADPKTLDEKQVDLIKKHLNMVFIHEIDPSYPKEQQDDLNNAHNGNKVSPPGTKPPFVVPSQFDNKVLRC